MRMKIELKVAAMSALLGAFCLHQHACAEPQDNFWLESEWATNLPNSYAHSVGFSTNGQIIIGNSTASILVFETGGFKVSFPTVLGVTYRVLRSDALISWVAVGPDIPGTGAVAEVLDAEASNVSTRYYRVLVVR